SAVFVGEVFFLRPGPHSYLVFPFAIWAALRFGQPGAALTTLLISSIAIWGTAIGGGPVTPPTTHQSPVLLQIYMGVVAVTTLFLAAVTAERERAKEAARRSEDELKGTLEATRVGAWTWDTRTGEVSWTANLEAIHGLPPGAFAGTFEAF